ncbi:unnamed protein product [Rotaria sordida]|uniref:NAD(P)(+)--arginine ADP-ribosyltransferase n=1 Tax=Rotaria sordida TaxID=392033 RepID=A0A815MFE8_9BILA|nr:unnamed protein product [Rotaria sordida]CAF1420872.1 unnamed protein product [Rotaria sordida]
MASTSRQSMQSTLLSTANVRRTSIKRGETIENNPSNNRQHRVVENFIVIWSDPKIDQLDSDYQNSISHLRQIVNSIEIFTNADHCLDFLGKVKDEKVVLIVSGSFGQQIIPHIQELNQLESIYIFCSHKSKYEQWSKNYEKIKGVFTGIISICNVLKQDIRQSEANLISVTILPSSSKMKSNEIDPTFMYSQLLKEILIDIEKEDTEKQKLIEFCREQYSQNDSELEFINEFDQGYLKQSPLWWYSREGFVYKMLNRALRSQDIEIISKMAFFVRDAHQQITQLYLQKSKEFSPFNVYRGQGMMNEEFEHMRQNSGGLISFNVFLSTSVDRQVALEFAQKSQNDSSKTAVLFQMEVDPTNASNPFASMENISFFPTEKEILFSMNTVFRIEEIKQIEDQLWQVNLSLTHNDDQQLKRVAESIRQDLADGRTGWHKLAILMAEIGDFDKADELCQQAFEKISNDDWSQLTHFHQFIGFIKMQKGDYSNSLSHLQKCLDIWLNKFPGYDQHLPSIYLNMGQSYYGQGQYDEALKTFQYALDKALQLSQPEYKVIGTLYYSIGQMLCDQGNFDEALKNYNLSLKVRLENFSSIDPSIAETYNGIGEVYQCMKDFNHALIHYEKAFEIQQRSLLPGSLEIVASYNRIGQLYFQMEDYSRAISYFDKARQIQEKSLPKDSPQLGLTNKLLGDGLKLMKDYSHSLAHYETALQISEKSFPIEDPSVAIICSNIGEIYYRMKDYSRALSYYQKAIESGQKAIPSNYLSMDEIYYETAKTLYHLKRYKEAKENAKQTYRIRRNTLGSQHPNVIEIKEYIHKLEKKLESK